VRLRHGLDGNGQRTLQQIGEDLRLSRERILQLQERALRRIKTTGTRRRALQAQVTIPARH
jgi:RNA polymerase primary sigma factor